MSDKGTPERAIEDRRIRTGYLLALEQEGTITPTQLRELELLKAIARREAASLESERPDEAAARDAENVTSGVTRGFLGALGAWLKGLFLGGA